MKRRRSNSVSFCTARTTTSIRYTQHRRLDDDIELWAKWRRKRKEEEEEVREEMRLYRRKKSDWDAERKMDEGFAAEEHLIGGWGRGYLVSNGGLGGEFDHLIDEEQMIWPKNGSEIIWFRMKGLMMNLIIW